MKKPSTLWSALGSAVFLRLVMAVVNFGQFWVFTRLLAADELGGYSLILGVMMMLHAMPLLGLSVPLIRRVATDPDKASIEVSNALALSVPMALVIALGVFLYGVTKFQPALHGPMACLALTMIPVAWILVAECALLGKERMDVITKVQGLEAVGRLVFGVLAIQLGYGLQGIFVCILVLRTLVALYYKVSSLVPEVRWSWVSRPVQRRNLGEIPTFIGIVVLAALVVRVDVLVLEHTRDLTEVALLAAGARLYEAALMVPTMAAQALMPTLARICLAVAALVLLLALFLLTGPYGAVGAAWAALIAHVVRLGLRVRWAAGRMSFPALPGSAIRHLFGMVMGMFGLRLVHLLHPAAEPLWAMSVGLLAWYMTARLTGVLRYGWWLRLKDWRASTGRRGESER
ncbi:MAG: hypothetical protein C4K60_20660 [Ideonella sp. MAG2]|nr:MAG: hypothetical protein C4K60_20660 [Ideonella sp. MAG2]